jgi:very-short-patch-repair endonuclease
LQSRPDTVIAALAERQHGVVARTQLASLGLGEGAIEDRIARRLLHRIHRGVYSVGHRLRTSEATWMAAVLAAGPGAVLSHRSAAALWGMRSGTSATVDVTAPRQCRRPGIRAHHLVLPPDEVAVENGIRVTNPARTLFDLAAVVNAQQLRHALNEAEIRRLASPLPLDALIARHPHRRGIDNLKRALAHQRATGETVIRSEFEQAFLDFLDAHALPRPRTNEPLGPYHPDALWPNERLIVELDSYAIHTTREAFENDRTRDRDLQANGYRVLRITWRQLTTNPEGLAAELRSHLTAGPRPR